MKKSLNLTIDSEIISKAKKIASNQNTSLSSLIEENLKQLNNISSDMINELFNNFHKKYSKKSKEPSDVQIKKWLDERKK